MAEPHYSFTIPSIHDDIPLHCRIYHPEILSRLQTTPSENKNNPWQKKGIVMAHPYAPMGGSYDDRIVGVAVDEFLKNGWVVATFNFRGAHGSKGHTSWSGKPELDDYLSFAGFFMHYLSYLRPFPAPNTTFTSELHPVSPPAHTRTNRPRTPPTESPLIILGGYSYGSLILRHLPPVPSILQPFSAPLIGSAASEILLRAHKLADQSHFEWINLARDHERRSGRGPTSETKLSVTMGGEETSPDKRRSSREIRRSMDNGGGHRSLDLGTRIRSLSHRRRRDEGAATPPEAEAKSADLDIAVPDVRYLLLSPLTPPISTLAAPGLGHRFWARARDGDGEIVGKHISLAVYGDQDIFSSAKKTRDWAERLKEESGGRFSSVEVEGAGHFWHEHGAEEKLRSALRDWEERLRN